MTVQPLKLKIIKRGEQIGPELTVHADPDDTAWMRDHLVTALERENWPTDRIGEFVMEIRPLPNPDQLLHTFAATSREW